MDILEEINEILNKYLLDTIEELVSHYGWDKIQNSLINILIDDPELSQIIILQVFKLIFFNTT